MKDILGIEAKNDDVLFDGKTHWRYCEDVNGAYLLSCELGYEHDLSHISEMSIMGHFKGNEELFHCD